MSAWRGYEEFRGRERDIALRWMPACRVVAALEPGDVDAGGGQDPGRRTQSNRLIRRRHHPGVVHAHLNLLSRRRSVLPGGVYDT